MKKHTPLKAEIRIEFNRGNAAAPDWRLATHTYAMPGAKRDVLRSMRAGASGDPARWRIVDTRQPLHVIHLCSYTSTPPLKLQWCVSP